MTRLSCGVAVGVLVLAGSLGVAAQAPQGQGQGRAAGGRRRRTAAASDQPSGVPERHDARQQVVQIMQQINAALGVTCATATCSTDRATR